MKCECLHKFSFIFLSTILISAQTVSAGENSLKRGKWALQFEIDRNFDLTSFQGQTISFKKHTADNRAFRLGLSISLDIGDGEYKQTTYTAEGQPGDVDINNQSFGLNLQKIYYRDVSATANVFYGFGLTSSFTHSKYETETIYTYDTVIDIRRQKNISDSWAAGASGLIGVEWFFNKSMSLLGEYATSVTYGGTSSKDEFRRTYNGLTVGRNDESSESKRIKLSASSVKFGLSVYF